ncbi:MAG: metallophosphoesterase [Chitinophagaceae bacterium]
MLIAFKKILFLILLLIEGTLLFAQYDSINQRIVLIGDAGQLTGGRQPELDLLKSIYNLDDARTSLIYLGDNIYPAGLPSVKAKNYAIMQHILQSQVEVVKGKKSQAFFIPGNHDWKKGKKYGWEQVKNQFNYIESLREDNIHFVPENGCPGPVEIKLANEIVLVVMDTQWWLHPFKKPGVSSDCKCKTTNDVISSLQDILFRNRDKLLLFASHHPFRTNGKHGGYFTWKQHLFPLTDIHPSLYIPLPVIGSIYPILRGMFGNIQDTRHPVYKRMVRSIDEVLKTHPYSIRTAGHEHTLQLIRDEGQYYIVSGGGSKSDQVKKVPSTIFASPSTGFAVLEILTNGKIWLKFFSSRNLPREQPLFSTLLKSLNQ